MNQVLCNIFYPAFCSLLQLLPGARTQLIYFWFRVVFTFIFRYSVEGVNTNIKYIIVPVNQLYSFLYLPVNLDFFKSAEFPNTCLLYTSPSPRDRTRSRMPSSA